jgi:NAD(P)-dependent dehydrogenase (short-subunit alcohol dehydrogenase family)
MTFTDMEERNHMPLPVPDISRNLFDLSGYCSIVTGAGQGIGLVLAEALAYAGSDLVLTERNAEHLKVAAGKIEAIGRNVTTVACDVAADDTPDRLVKAALALSGRIDVLINNAGFMTFADMLTVEDAVWDNIYAVNVRAPMRITRAVLPEMVKAKRGSVINIGSSWSSRASVFNQDGGGVDYCSSKAALQCLTRAAAQDVAVQGGAGQCHRARCGRHADAHRPPRQTLRVRKVHPARPHAARGRYRRHSDLPRLGRQRLHHGADPAR